MGRHGAKYARFIVMRVFIGGASGRGIARPIGALPSRGSQREAWPGGAGPLHANYARFVGKCAAAAEPARKAGAFLGRRWPNYAQFVGNTACRAPRRHALRRKYVRFIGNGGSAVGLGSRTIRGAGRQLCPVHRYRMRAARGGATRGRVAHRGVTDQRVKVSLITLMVMAGWVGRSGVARPQPASARSRLSASSSSAARVAAERRSRESYRTIDATMGRSRSFTTSERSLPRWMA